MDTRVIGLLSQITSGLTSVSDLVAKQVASSSSKPIITPQELEDLINTLTSISNSVSAVITQLQAPVSIEASVSSPSSSPSSSPTT